MNLKKISPDGVPHALDRAERYRLLNEPVQAESICRDVLAVYVDNYSARCALIHCRSCGAYALQYGHSRSA